MQKLLSTTALVVALTTLSLVPLSAQTQVVAVPSELAELGAASSEDEQAAALEAAKAWLESAFDEARPIVMASVQDPALPIEFRSRLLRSVIEVARLESRLDFDTDAGPAYQDLAEGLAAGPERSALHQTYGNLVLSRGQFASAEALYQRAIEEGTGRSIGEQANLRSSLGVAQAQQGKLDDALDAMLEAFRLFEQTEEGPSSQLLRNIGAISVYLEDWERSVTFSRMAIDKDGADNPAAADVYSNLAAALIAQGDFEAALEALQRGIALGEAHGQPNASAISNLGYVLRELERPEEALAHFERAAELNRAASDSGSLAISLKNLGETLIRLGRRQEAYVVLQESLSAYRQADIKVKRLELYPVMVENLEQLQHYPEALAMMREYRQLSEELVNADAQTRVAELQTAFDLERRERELAESERERLEGEAELAALRAEQSQQRLVRTLLLVGVIVLALFLILLMRSLRLRTRANRLLAEKNAEIEEQRKALAEKNSLLHRQSVEDELTGLGNRRSLRQLLEAPLPATLVDRPVLLVLIDLDRFKGINDRYGHPVGDEVLARFARLLQSIAGPDDALARWGGEEFLWLRANSTIAEAASCFHKLADCLRDADLEIDGHRLSITCSMGVAPVVLSGKDPQASLDLALKIADAALYEAKHAGRDGWAGFERRANDYSLFEGTLDIDALLARDALVRIRQPQSVTRQ